MGILHHLFDKADPEEQGSFCNDDEEHVDNMSAIDSEIARRTAEAEGAKTFDWDRDESIDTRYNRVIYEKDDDSDPDADFKEAKYRPGR